MRRSLSSVSYVRNFVFGVEDSLVSTVGLLSGVAIAGLSSSNIILTGVVLIFVEAFSMAVGSFLAEHASEEYEVRREVSNQTPLKDGLVMFVSYFVSGFVPLFPYFFLPVGTAFAVSIVLSLSALFLLGIVSAKLSQLNLWRHGWQMLLIGGIAIAVGIVAGKIVLAV